MNSPASILFDINGNPVGVSGSMPLPTGSIGQLVAGVDQNGNVRYLNFISSSVMVTGSLGLGGSVAVSNFPLVQTITGSLALSQPATVQGTVTAVITGTVQTSVTNFPSVQTVTGTVASVITGTVNTAVTNQVTVTTTGSLPVSFSGVQTVAGTVTSVITGTVQTAIQSLPNITGSVNITNSIFPVTGTVALSGQPISVQGTVTSAITGTINTAVTNQVTVTTTGSLPVSFSGVQTVTGTVLALPTGTQTVAGTVTSVITGTVNTAVTNFPATQTVTGSIGITNFPTTQTVAGTVTSVITGTVNTAVTNQVTVTTTGSLPVSFSGVQTVTGTVAITGQPIAVQGSVTSVITGTVQTAVQSLPNITGSVNVTNSVFTVTGTVLALPTGTQTVAGTVTSVITGTINTNVVNLPAVQTITGTVSLVGQPITVTGAVDTAITGTVTVTSTGSLSILERRSSSAITSSINANNSTSQILLSSSLNRLQGLIFNDSTGLLYLTLGSSSSTTSFTVRLDSRGYYEVPIYYVGVVSGIWSNNNGAARMTEIRL